jgi:endonuclease-3 related protein
MNTQPCKQIPRIHQILSDHFGPLHWWPAETPFEVMVGAILTQNTAWTNVEKAIQNLKQADALSLEKLALLPVKKLEVFIRPAGFFRQKALRLQNLAEHLVKIWQSDLSAFCHGPLDEARARLLARPGIGPETADSILLYAANRPSFVVDAYTRRIFERIGLLAGKEKYDDIRLMFMQNLVTESKIYNEYHAQIVQLAKTCCRKKRPFCPFCPLRQECRFAKIEGMRAT